MKLKRHLLLAALTLACAGLAVGVCAWIDRGGPGRWGREADNATGPEACYIMDLCRAVGGR